MTVRNSGFVGARTSKLVEVVSLFKDCLKISLTHESSSKAGFTLENATKLELYGPDDEIQSFFNNGPVVGFSVTEFEDSKMRMIKRGVEFIGNAQRADGVTWQRESYRAYVDLRLRGDDEGRESCMAYMDLRLRGDDEGRESCMAYMDLCLGFLGAKLAISEL